jgi:hypothetical protein
MRQSRNVKILAGLMLATFFWAGCESGMDLTAPKETESELNIQAHNSHSQSKTDFDPSFIGHRENGMPGHYSETYISRENGGILEFRSGTLEVHPRSIDESKTIGARTYSLQQRDFFKKIYEFDPSGTTFDPPAILTLSYCDLGPTVPETIVLRVFNDETNQWEVASFMVNDPINQTFTGNIQHFSRYSLSGNGQVLRPQTRE